jgi:hypothetical protein
MKDYLFIIFVREFRDGQGICLDEDLRFGKSESCLTFANPPLAAMKDFEVSVLEVIGFSCG